jgi:hypothetical protein
MNITPSSGCITISLLLNKGEASCDKAEGIAHLNNFGPVYKHVSFRGC